MTAHDGADPALLSGLDFLRMAVALPVSKRPAIIGDLFEMEVLELERGRVVFAMPADPRFANPLGTLHGGACATILDSVTGCAAHTTLEAGVGYGTVEIKVNFVRTVPTDGRMLTAVGTLIHEGRTIITSEGKVTDDRGNLVAHASATLMVYR